MRRREWFSQKCVLGHSFWLGTGLDRSAGEGQTRLWGQSESTGPGAGLFPTCDLAIQLVPNSSLLLRASADVQVDVENPGFT